MSISPAPSGDLTRPFVEERSFAPTVDLAALNSALVVVDVQYAHASIGHGFGAALERLTPGSCAYYEDRVQRLVLPQIAELLAAFRARDMPVIYLTLGAEDRALRDLSARQRQAIRSLEDRAGVPDIMWRGNHASQIMEEVAPLEDELVLGKTTFGAFASTDLERLAHDQGIDNLVFTGVTTNCCIETTAREGADRGFGCVLVDDAMAEYDQASHDATLQLFASKFGRVVPSAAELVAAIH